ncbi:MAG: hypothetical protein PHV16_04405 [Candidatus Nanoarchaeia archaeon]|nr:hypothetical protein [Candidatus Nanoarchaeia archaeon]
MKLLLSIFVLLFFIFGCEQTTRDYSFEESKEIATLFVLNSPTYQYNGKNLELLDSGSLECDNCFMFVFRFSSAYDGYGDRQDKIPNEIETENIIEVIVQKGEVIQATINNEWNEILQRKISDYEK